jgi:hypothetical protein
MLLEWPNQSRGENPCLHLGPILAVVSDVPSKFYVLILHEGCIWVWRGDQTPGAG